MIQDISKEISKVVSTINGVNEDLKLQINVIENSVHDFKKIIETINVIFPQIEEINSTKLISANISKWNVEHLL